MSFSHHKCLSYDVVLSEINDEASEVNHKRTKIQYLYATINPTIKLTYPFFNLFMTPRYVEQSENTCFHLTWKDSCLSGSHSFQNEMQRKFIFLYLFKDYLFKDDACVTIANEWFFCMIKRSDLSVLVYRCCECVKQIVLLSTEINFN